MTVEDDEIKARIAMEQALRYTLQTHDYMKYLNQLYDARSNYIMLANSIILASIVGLISNLHPDFQKLPLGVDIGLGLAMAILVGNLLICMFALLLPSPPDLESPFHSSGVMPKKLKKGRYPAALEIYHSAIRTITIEKCLEHIARENFALASVVEQKNLWVHWAFRTLVFALILVVLTAGFLVGYIMHPSDAGSANQQPAAVVQKVVHVHVPAKKP